MSQSAPEPQQDSTPNDPDSQPNNAPVSAPNNHAFIGHHPANLAYFKTIPAILKIISVIIGLIAICFIVYGYNNATLFNEKHVYCDGPNGKLCKWDTFYEDQICLKEKGRKVCVNRMLIVPPLYIIGIAWAATVVVLFLLLLVDLSKKKGFSQADMIGHLVAAFLVIVSGLCVISFFIQVIKEDACSDDNLRVVAVSMVSGRRSKKYLGRSSARQYYITTTEGTEETTTSSSSSTSTTTKSSGQRQSPSETEFYLSILREECPELHRKKYYRWHFLLGGIFAVILGILYTVIAIFSMRARRPVGPGNRPDPQPGSGVP